MRLFILLTSLMLLSACHQHRHSHSHRYAPRNGWECKPVYKDVCDDLGFSHTEVESVQCTPKKQ